jgi:hypothetical protein
MPSILLPAIRALERYVSSPPVIAPAPLRNPQAFSYFLRGRHKRPDPILKDPNDSLYAEELEALGNRRGRTADLHLAAAQPEPTRGPKQFANGCTVDECHLGKVHDNVVLAAADEAIEQIPKGPGCAIGEVTAQRNDRDALQALNGGKICFHD